LAFRSLTLAARLPTYASLIVSALARWPERVAFVSEDRAITYREQADATRRLQLALRAAGVRRGDAVSVLAGSSPEAFFTAAATLCLGCRYVPLNPGFSPDDQAYVLEDAGVGTLVVDPRDFEETGGELAERSASVERVLGLGPSPSFRDIVATESGLAGGLQVEAEPDDVAVILYTGGSTGRPKGVTLSHSTLAFSALAMLAEWQWPEPVRLLAITQLAQGLIVPTSLRGGTVVLQREFDPRAVVEAVEAHQITATFLVSPMLYALLDHLPDGAHLATLETAVYGNAPVAPARLAEAIDRFGPLFMQEYSLSEATPACVLRREEHLEADLLSSCGRPIAGTEVELRDDEGAPVECGAIGEVCLRGPTLMSGYWNQPALTADAFDDGWLRTGDLAREDDRGFLHLVDRRKDMIITGGVNVYSRQVEDALCTVDGVAAAAVFPVPDQRAGEAVHATVVLRPEAQLDMRALQAVVERAKGPSHVPASIDFAPALPLTAQGKPDKRALRAPHWGDLERGIH
jgi:fatty-acyl-CoA synthase